MNLSALRLAARRTSCQSLRRTGSASSTRCLSITSPKPILAQRIRPRFPGVGASACTSGSWKGKAVDGGRKLELGRRALHASSVRQHGGIDRPEPGTGIKVHFRDSKGTLIRTVEANPGDDILSIAHEYDIDLEGACEGSVACSTCHVILSPEHYDALPEPDDDENDMLDMAFGLTDTSRLGCQVKLTKDLDGITCTLPAATRNMYVDGAKPTAH